MRDSKKTTSKPTLKKVTVVKLGIQKMNMLRGGNNNNPEKPGQSTWPECDVTSITYIK